VMWNDCEGGVDYERGLFWVGGGDFGGRGCWVTGGGGGGST
jgi:hypothetical protein